MKYINDIIFLIGFLLIIVPIFILDVFVGCFVLGAFFVFVSLVLGKKEVNK